MVRLSRRGRAAGALAVEFKVAKVTRMAASATVTLGNTPQPPPPCKSLTVIQRSNPHGFCTDQP